MAWKLSKTLTQQLDDVRAELDSEINELRSEFDEKSERWQESDKGTDVAAWLDELSDLVDALDSADPEPTS